MDTSKSSFLNTVIDRKMLVGISLFFILVTATMYSVTTLSNGSAVPALTSKVFLIIASFVVTTLWFTKLNLRKLKKEFTFLEYFKLVENIILFVVERAKYVRYISKSLVRTLINMMLLYVFLNYLLEPLLSPFYSVINNVVFYNLLTIAESVSIVLQLAIGIMISYIIFSVIYRHEKDKFAIQELEKILTTLNSMDVEVTFSHKNGLRLLDTDKLLGQLVEMNNENSQKLYIKIKKMYFDLQSIEITPENYRTKRLIQ
ncbi:hypothetical protein [Bacillus sp. 2205SS5-2]|uniref:hypothetical protein n=1 Tax=Bacillus sp. 2205SS5-2 TaxID=3109031 RepID=UPI003005C7FC